MRNMKTKFRQIKFAWDEFQREEEMNTDYRGHTKLIAYFHIFIFCSLFLLLIVSIFAATFITPFIIRDEIIQGDNGMNTALQKLNEIPQWAARTAVVSCMWFAIMTVGLGIVIQLMASFNLLNSTEVHVDPIRALEKIRFWRNATVVFTILDLYVFVGIFHLYLKGGLIVFIRLASLSHVSGFRKYLEREAAKRISSPSDIIIKH